MKVSVAKSFGVRDDFPGELINFVFNYNLHILRTQ